MGRLTDDREQSHREQGSALIIALVVLVLASTILAAVLTYTTTSLRTTRRYRDRTDQLQVANDAVEATIAAIRRPAGLAETADGSMQSRTDLLGTEGSPAVSREYHGYTSTCTAQPGSGVKAADDTYADRKVICIASDANGKKVLKVTISFTDQRGTSLGSAVEVLETRNYG